MINDEHTAAVGQLSEEHVASMTQFKETKEQEMEAMRQQLQARIDELLKQIEDEKQNMGAAGERRERELLDNIAQLKSDLAAV